MPVDIESKIKKADFFGNLFIEMEINGYRVRLKNETTSFHDKLHTSVYGQIDDSMKFPLTCGSESYIENFLEAVNQGDEKTINMLKMISIMKKPHRTLWNVFRKDKNYDEKIKAVFRSVLRSFLRRPSNDTFKYVKEILEKANKKDLAEELITKWFSWRLKS